MLTAIDLADQVLEQLMMTDATRELYLLRQPPDIVEWGESEFFIPETGRPIVFEPHQKDILRIMSAMRRDERSWWVFEWLTWMYSTIKKSGKTTISALVARWAAETWGPYQEVYNLGNKLPQAKDRAFKAVKRSIELAPELTRSMWTLMETTMTHEPSGSIVRALPINDEGEAGANQSLTVWTELWGFQYEDALRMWDEMMPVLTRPRSVRFVDTYAGYEGESTLLRSVWGQVLNEDGSLADGAERLHDDLPVYGNRSTGLVAYIDQGEAARRMPWQRGSAGEQWFAQQAQSERRHNYLRLHHNLWVSSVNALVPLELWDRLAYDAGPERFEDANGPVPVWLAADASIRRDCTALVAVTLRGDMVYELETSIWEPDGEDLDYEETLIPALEAAIERLHVAGVCYDEWQLHSVMQDLAKKYAPLPFYAFPQGEERLRADTNLVWRLTEGKLRHTGRAGLRQHVLNADSKDTHDGEALRIVKRDARRQRTAQADVTARPIDAVVALSMASWYATELWKPPKQSGARQVNVKW